MAIPTDRPTLIQYVLNKLGAPVLEVNVETNQLDERIDDALQYYQEFHTDALVRSYYKHLITADDVDNGYITVPQSFAYITRVIPFSQGATSGGGMFSFEYQTALNDYNGMRHGQSMSGYAVTKSHQALLSQMLGDHTSTTFNRHMNRVVFTDWGSLGEGCYTILDGYEVVDENTFSDIWNDRWLKDYAVALVKKQWGANLKKFGGMQLPGGVTIEAQTIFDEGNEEIFKLEEEMRLTYELPINFEVG